MLDPRRARALVIAALALFAAGCPDGSGITCPPGQTFCGGRCTFINTDPGNCGACGNACPGTLVCIAGGCGCPMGQIACGDTCIDPNVDPNNCGGCGVTCPSGQLCAAGACATTCGSNLTQCADLCVDTKSDPGNCGMCGQACAPGQVCCGGSCVVTGTNEHCAGCMPCMPGDFCTNDSAMGMGNICVAG